MPRLNIPDRDDVPEAAREMLNAVHDRLGVVPNVFRLLGSSPAVLKGFTALNDGLVQVLDAKLCERISLAIAEVNRSDYCLSLHHYFALNIARMFPEEIDLARKGGASNPKASVAVNFAVKVAKEGGNVADVDIAEIRRAGFSDAEVVAMIAVIAVNVLTNLLNKVAQTEIDFPALHAAD